MQEHQPRSARLAGAGCKRRGTRSLEGQEVATGDVGDALDGVGIGAVDQQHLAHHARGRARHQRRKRGNGCLFDALGRDDDAQHGLGL